MMQLTQFTDYSLRALIYVALRKELCTIKDIAVAYDLSNHHMVKIIHKLSKLGLIKTVRGKKGGILMAVQPETINLARLIVQLESHFDLVPCFNQEKNKCCITSVCKLKDILHEAQAAFIRVLEHYTLADVVLNEGAISALLNIRQ
jgi:Rrf2 family nitric oxide-sensitive transcriptional repressor